MDASSDILAHANDLYSRAAASTSNTARPPIYKAIGLTLAVASGLFIGVSFVLKKIGLLKANVKYNEEAGEGYGYLKNAWWWSGMTLMIVGEICNFVAYAFVDAILVTPLGALSVVVTTILSAIFLKERLSFVGKVGCFNCIIGSVVIVLNAPTQSSVATIQDMKHFVITPGFLTYAGVIIVGSAFIALWVGPRYGKKSMLVYLSVCSLIGGLSVVATQGLGAAVVTQASGTAQFNQWFLYVLLVFVVATLVTEIIFLNKALNLFNAALVTPTYYVFFTSATIVTSSILFQGFKGTPISITTVIMGFLQICAGVVLLQMSKSAKDVPDAAVFKGDLDQVREIAEQEQPETEPKADALRGTAAIIRRISHSRKKMEETEARRYYEEKAREQLEPLRENEIAEWDGLRRRKTVIGETPNSPVVRRKTIHPPLGMSHFPEGSDQNDTHHDEIRDSHGFLDSIRDRTQSVLHPRQALHAQSAPANMRSPIGPVALTEINIRSSKVDTPTQLTDHGGQEGAQEHVYGLPPGLRKGPEESGIDSPWSKPLPSFPKSHSSTNAADIPPPTRTPTHTSRRQFSFSNFIRGQRTPDPDRPASASGPRHANNAFHQNPSRSGIGSRGSSYSSEQKKAMKTATEEERLGLVKGDSHAALLQSDPTHSHSKPFVSATSQHEHLYQPPSPIPSEDDEDEGWQMTKTLSDEHVYHRPPAYRQSPEPLSQQQREHSPPRAYQHHTNTFNPTSTQPASLPSRVIVPEQGAAYSSSQTSSTNRSPQRVSNRESYHVPIHPLQRMNQEPAAQSGYTVGGRREDYEDSQKSPHLRQQRPGQPREDSSATNHSGRPAFL